MTMGSWLDLPPLLGPEDGVSWDVPTTLCERSKDPNNGLILGGNGQIAIMADGIGARAHLDAKAALELGATLMAVGIALLHRQVDAAVTAQGQLARIVKGDTDGRTA